MPRSPLPVTPPRSEDTPRSKARGPGTALSELGRLELSATTSGRGPGAPPGKGCTHQPGSFHLHPSHPSLFPSLAQPQKSCGKLTSADLACNARPLGPLVLPRRHEIPSARVTVQRASPALVLMMAAPASLLETQVSGRTRVRGIGVSRARPRELRLPRFPFRRKKKRQLAAGVRLILHKHALQG